MNRPWPFRGILAGVAVALLAGTGRPAEAGVHVGIAVGLPLYLPPCPYPYPAAVYAPFYAAGLVLRYGVYYVVVAPLEVFGRALDYGVEGGVAPPGNGDAAKQRADQ